MLSVRECLRGGLRLLDDNGGVRACVGVERGLDRVGDDGCALNRHLIRKGADIFVVEDRGHFGNDGGGNGPAAGGPEEGHKNLPG